MSLHDLLHQHLKRLCPPPHPQLELQDQFTVLTPLAFNKMLSLLSDIDWSGSTSTFCNVFDLISLSIVTPVLVNLEREREKVGHTYLLLFSISYFLSLIDFISLLTADISLLMK